MAHLPRKPFRDVKFGTKKPPFPRSGIGVFCIHGLPFLTSEWRGANLRSGSASVIHSTPPGVSQAGLAPVSVSADSGVFSCCRVQPGRLSMDLSGSWISGLSCKCRKTKSPAALESASRAFLGKLAFSGPMWTLDGPARCDRLWGDSNPLWNVPGPYDSQRRHTESLPDALRALRMS
jgi:hypothetical protein